MFAETVVVVTLNDIIGYILIGLFIVFFVGLWLFIKIGTWIADRKEEKRRRKERAAKQKEYDIEEKFRGGNNYDT